MFWPALGGALRLSAAEIRTLRASVPAAAASIDLRAFAPVARRALAILAPAQQQQQQQQPGAGVWVALPGPHGGASFLWLNKVWVCCLF